MTKLNENIEIGNTGKTLNDLLKKQDKGKIIWTNPNPSYSFAAQTLSINASDYDAIMVYWSYQNGSSQRYMSGYILKGTDCVLFIPYIADNSWYLRKRSVTFSSNGSISFGGASLNNYHVIPIYVIGYKNIFSS